MGEGLPFFGEKAQTKGIFPEKAGKIKGEALPLFCPGPFGNVCRQRQTLGKIKKLPQPFGAWQLFVLGILGGQLLEYLPFKQERQLSFRNHYGKEDKNKAGEQPGSDLLMIEENRKENSKN